MHHKKLDTSTREEFNEEVKGFAKITNKRSRGFRAPTFSLNQNTRWALDVLAENNYLYDSSVFLQRQGYMVFQKQIQSHTISLQKI